ncbi:hypothetical protein [Hafnia alvei]|uniref:Fungal N-terminal domain-containing protein n=1 Tax=Hafnia alvei ATCC 13337 TaxID=910996 RepID=A0ABD3ZC67_HAFAL|nr:hypothetical protein [Hafnia alvei]KFC86065.1 hypothetical protein GHAL_3751 [Hafnia alvei ATCC 13337]RLR09740.1 hypothetical protein EAE69_12530 [Hafnia alvei ATCC 13337]WQD24164.1 hypothetical protein U0008_15260 [Hafnia alvei]
MLWGFKLEQLNLIIAAISAIGAIASAIAAVSSKETANRALSLQREIADFDRDRHLYESLKSFAEQANSYAKDKRGSDWSFSDAANIISKLSLAMRSIVERCRNEEEKKGLFIRFFKGQLNIELFQELNDGDGPDVIYHSKEPSSIGSDIHLSWFEVVSFFGFMHATDEDLSD